MGERESKGKWEPRGRVRGASEGKRKKSEVRRRKGNGKD